MNLGKPLEKLTVPDKNPEEGSVCPDIDDVIVETGVFPVPIVPFEHQSLRSTPDAAIRTPRNTDAATVVPRFCAATIPESEKIVDPAD